MTAAKGDPRAEEDRLFSELRHALSEAKGPVQEIEVGVTLSIALGKQRPSVSCGGCSTPLEFEGIPARTNPLLRSAFRLIVATPSHGE